MATAVANTEAATVLTLKPYLKLWFSNGIAGSCTPQGLVQQLLHCALLVLRFQVWVAFLHVPCVYQLQGIPQIAIRYAGLHQAHLK